MIDEPDHNQPAMTEPFSRFPGFAFQPAVPPAGAVACPFTTAPDANVRLAQKLTYQAGLIPADFCGRAGLLLTRTSEGWLQASLALDPQPSAAGRALGEIRAADLWPGLEEADVPNEMLINGRGEAKTLRTLIEEVFAPFPVRAENHGGREQAVRRAHWRRLLLDGLSTPAVRLIRSLNESGGADRAVALAEWWVGPTPSWEMRFDRTFCAPRAGARFLFEWLLTGVPHDPPQTVLRGDVPEIPVLYEDDALIVISKPARLASVPGGSEIVSAVSILQETRGELHVVHRLDMGTSGVLAFAKTKEALRVMNAAFRRRDACKHYVARLEGVLGAEEGDIDLPLGLNAFDRPRQCVLPESEGGKACRTHFAVRETVNTVSGPKTVVDLYPETGRTHQLRLHCAHARGLGMPIDGDPFYGRFGMLAEGPGFRLCLHAAELTVEHPVTGKPLHVTAPADFPDF